MARFPRKGDRASGISGAKRERTTVVECLPCTMGNHESCWKPNVNLEGRHAVVGGLCCCPTTVFDLSNELTFADLTSTPSGESHGITDRSSEDGEKKERGGQIKEANEVTDHESTGRKRAAKLFPIQKGMPCEWRGLKVAGGGVMPIVGCLLGDAKAIHHGPNKSTLANFVGNVHRICDQCHNRWHTVNDKYYTGERPPGISYYPLDEYEVFEHLPFVYATDAELAKSEVAWLESKAATLFQEFIREEIDKLKVLTRQV